jgi:DNA-directed RNA polymerase specialized sigma24 family protein
MVRCNDERAPDTPRAPRTDAWTRRFQTWAPRAFRVVYGQLGCRFDPQLAEEMIHDALSRAWWEGLTSPGAFQCFAHFCNWVRRTAAWRAHDVLRRRVRHEPLPDDRPGGEGRNRQLPERPGEGLRKERRQVWECLQRLPADERALVLDYYYEGHTDAQLGAGLYGDGSPQARGLRARRVRLRALAHLRRLLLARGVGPEGARGALRWCSRR